jgi:hypothetical protein
VCSRGGGWVVATVSVMAAGSRWVCSGGGGGGEIWVGGVLHWTGTSGSGNKQIVAVWVVSLMAIGVRGQA